MRPQLAVLAAWASASARMVSAQSASALAGVEEALSAVLPDCAVTCMLTTIPESTCSFTNNTCICNNANLTAAIAACIGQSCTVTESLVALKFSKTSCGAPVRNQDLLQHLVPYLLLAVSITAVGVRMITRSPWINGKWAFWWDDFLVLTCLAALIVAAAFSTLLVNEAKLGHDMWMVTPHQINLLLKYFLAEEMLYSWVVCFTKVAMACFYRRVFLPDAGSKKLRIAINLLLYLSLAFFVAQTLSILLLCQPISYTWTSWDGEHTGTCGHRGPQAYGNGAISIALDLLAFALPIPKLVGLNMNRRRKVMLIGMFTSGIFVTICSAVRIEQVALYSETQNPTYDYVGLSMWSVAEMHASVIVVCMPSMAKFVQRCYANLAQRTTKDTGPNGPSASNRQPLTPQDYNGSAKKIRGPLSRMLYALDNMTNVTRSGETFKRGGSVSSQKTLTRGSATTHSVGDLGYHATAHHSDQESADYSAKHPYAQYEKRASYQENVELQDMDMPPHGRPERSLDDAEQGLHALTRP